MRTQHQIIAILFLLAGIANLLPAQVIRAIRPFSTKGTISKVSRSSVVMNDKSGRVWQLRYGGADGVVLLGKNGKFQARKPVIEVSGNLGLADIKKEMAVQLDCFIDDKGRIRVPVDEVKWIDESKMTAGVKLNKKKSNDRGETHCRISGTVDRVDPKGFMLKVPRSRLADKGLIAVPLKTDVEFILKTRDLSKAREGDAVTEVSGIELSTRDFVIQKLAVRLAKSSAVPTDKGSRKRKPKKPTVEILDSKYEALSDAPVTPRTVRDRFVWITTDLSDRKTRMLLDELSAELNILARFYARPPSTPIKCYVVADLEKWSSAKIPQEAREALSNEKPTVLVTGDKSNSAKKVALYSPANTLIVRAELVKAYSHQTFGNVGPEWFAEGMAEVGKYWQEPTSEVQISNEFLKVFEKAKTTKSLEEIMSPSKSDPTAVDSTSATKDLRTADKRRQALASLRKERERKAYRWALCYMLAHNSNYQRKFKELGKSFMLKRDTTFDDAFGKVLKQLSFEFEQFTRNISNGYRIDSNVWRWSHRFKAMEKSKTHKVVVQAQSGWQPVAIVEEGTAYDVVAKGKWRIDGTGTETTADGDKSGVGKLVAAVLLDSYELTEPFPIGVGKKVRSPASGKLYVRCDEKWNALADNSGKLTAYIRLSKQAKK